jgi:hypothetical protein
VVPEQILLCKTEVLKGGGCEEFRLLGYKKPVRTSQETHYVSATEPRFEVFTAVTMKNVIVWYVTLYAV